MGVSNYFSFMEHGDKDVFEKKKILVQKFLLVQEKQVVDNFNEVKQIKFTPSLDPTSLAS